MTVTSPEEVIIVQSHQFNFWERFTLFKTYIRLLGVVALLAASVYSLAVGTWGLAITILLFMIWLEISFLRDHLEAKTEQATHSLQRLMPEMFSPKGR